MAKEVTTTATTTSISATTSIKPSLLCSKRLNLALMMFLGCVILYALRNNISFTIVCMAESESITAIKSITPKCNSNSTFINFFKDNTSDKAIEVKREFYWPKKTQGIILSAFFWGYMTSQILGGYLAQRIGAKRVVGVSILISSILTLLSPVSARLDVVALICVRALLGFIQGTIFPAMHSMWALWAPPLERGMLTGVSYAGSQIGLVIVMPLSGFLCQYGFDGGWPSIFYVLGVAGLLWCVIWFISVADSPQKHPSISEDELEYINDALNPSGKRSAQTTKKLPIKSILTSKAVLACFIGHFAGDWGAYTMGIGLPLYMNDALGLDLASMGMLSSIPYIAYFIMINLGGYIADQLQNSGTLSTLNTRRCAMLLSLGGQAFFLILMGYLECGQELLLIILLTASLGISGFQYSGFVVNYLDICPQYAGAVIGIGQTLSCLAGILSPLAIGYLTPTSLREEWQHVFYLTALVLIVGAVLFSIFASATVQPWAIADEQYDDEKVEKDENFNSLKFAANSSPKPLLEPLINSEK